MNPARQPKSEDLPTVWERRVRRTAMVMATATGLISGGIAAILTATKTAMWPSLALAGLIPYLVYTGLTRRLHRRRRILAEPFPPRWEAVLQQEVLFYRTLPPDEQKRFRRELQVFLGEKRITGIKFELDTTTRVLAAASAIIPIFGFPEWEWDQISEILIYPDRFDNDFAFAGGDKRHTLGMVGTGALNRLMILSRPDLLAGFRNPGDKRNVGLHEFAHLLDKSDGSIDGLPGAGLERAAIGPWIDLVRRKMAEMERGESDIDPYGLTNEAEFFAVTTEYFFERPGVMKRKHPQLYAMLARVFNQNPGARAAVVAREMAKGTRRFGRNSPCPCGSGTKYKKCCLRNSRGT